MHVNRAIATDKGTKMTRGRWIVVGDKGFEPLTSSM